MQLYLPTGSHLSVVVVIHGGYWRSTYGMELAEPLGRDLTRYGVAAAVIEYRRVGEGGGWPTTLADVARAVDSLALQGQFVADGRLQLDRVAAIGHSAGGHLALWLATTDIPADRVVALAPVCDLREAIRRGLGSDAARAFLGEIDPDEADPMLLLDERPEAEIRIVHGVDDDVVPVELARNLVERHPWIVLDEVPCEHFEVIEPGSAVWPAVLSALGSARSSREPRPR